MKRIDKIEILSSGCIQVRMKKIEVLELKDGNKREIDSGYHRQLLIPGKEDLHEKEYEDPTLLNKIKAVVWTKEVIARFKGKK